MPKTKNPQTPDITYDIDVSDVMDKVLGPVGKEMSEAERQEAYHRLPVDVLTAALAVFENRMARMSEDKSLIKAELLQRPEAEISKAFGKGDPFVCICDKSSRENYGGIQISQKKETIYSTQKTANRDKVVQALDKAGIKNNFGDVQYRLDNGRLFEAFRNNALPAEVSNLLTVTEVSKMEASYVKPLEEKGE